MELAQKVDISIDVAEVWRGLNDPTILKQSLIGCETFALNDAGIHDVVMREKVGSVGAKFILCRHARGLTHARGLDE
jgi:carbon monoxide dehydrogenase subunit G